jgi:hypothetical protein
MIDRENVKLALLGVVLIVGFATVWGCAAKTLPPSEATVAGLKAYRDEIARLVAAGEVSPGQGRDRFYARLAEVKPALPGLDEFLEYRSQLRVQVPSGQLNEERANTLLSQREAEMLSRWEEMAAQYAAEQRRLEQIQRDYERDYVQERRIEEGSGIRNLPRP